MITNLRRKFVLIAMLSTLAVLAAIIGTINISNYYKMVKKADGMTALLARDGESFEEMLFGEEPLQDGGESDAGGGGEKNGNTQNSGGNAENNQNNDASVESVKSGEKNPGSEKKDKNDNSQGRRDTMSPETPFETRYFIVTLSDDGTVVSSDLDQIAAVDEETAEQYAAEAAEKGKTAGYISIYRYYAEEADENTKYVFLDCRKELASFRTMLLTSVTVSALGLGAVLALVLFFSRLVFRPVEESLRKQKQFITDASHELKTPLTIIDANTEVMEMESGESQWTKSTRKQIQRLSGLVQQLVTLTRLDEGRDKDEKAEFCISDAVGESAEPYKAPAQVQGKTLEMKIEENILYTGNERSIRQLVGILSDNAVKYTPKGGRICISLYKKGKKIYLEAINDAEDIPQGKLDILFERFYRLDSSRNSGTGGSGIGLSIAQAIVYAHRGKITAESPDGRSLNVHVVL